MLKKELKADEYRLLFRRHPWISQITFSGGEPFMKKDFLEIVFAALDEIKNLFYINIITNGINKEMIIKQVKKIFGNPRLKRLHIAISLDGNQKTHDKIRGVQGNYKSARETFFELKSLNQRKLLLHYSYTISPYNIGKMQAFLDKTNIDPNNIVVCFAQKSSRYNLKKGNNEFFLTKEEIKKEIKVFLKNYRIRRIEDIVQLIFLKLFLKNKRIPCVAGSNTFHIDPYGNIYQCSLKNNIVGNIRDGIKFRTPPKNCSCFTPCESYFGILKMNPLKLIRLII